MPEQLSATVVDGDLLDGCAILDTEKLTTAFGHLSARAAPGQIRITGNAGPGLNRHPGDLLTLDRQGAVLDGDPGQRAGEAAIHLGIYARRDDVQAICRFHGPACLAFSALGRPLPAVIGMGLFVGHEVPLHDTQITITTPEQGERLSNTLGDGLAVLIRGFGAVTVGQSVGDAVVRAWLMERNAQAILDASPAGTPLPYPPDATNAFHPDHSAPARGQLNRAWQYLKERAER